jgi:hypothetical protein
MTGDIIITSHIEGGQEVLRELSRMGAQARGRAAKAVKEASFAAERGIKDAMPVDTGRARASWGHWSKSDLVKPDAQASEADSHWEERDGGLTTEQGSNLGYIQTLNEGHSQQAPAGFIDKVVERAGHALSRLLAEIVRG